MSATVRGIQSWYADRDGDGQRTYHLVTKVYTTSTDDGPFTVLAAPGLPQPGDSWQFGNDDDQWAYCGWEAKVKPVLDGEPNTEWTVDQTFTTKPSKRCQQATVVDPLLEPQKISGNYVRDKEEATVDRFGAHITNSAWEQIRGPQAEFDVLQSTFKIEQNVAQLGAEVFDPMKNTVNDAPLWDFPRRAVKLSNVSFERKFTGQCQLYYTRTLEFEAKVRRYELFGMVGAGVVMPGSGFEGGELLTLIGGAYRRPATVVVTDFDESGSITEFFIVDPGDYISVPANPVPCFSDVSLSDVTINASWATGFLVSAWDRDVLDEGTKCLNGRWLPAQGSGCTLGLTTVGGAIVSASVAAAGTGYPKNSTFGLIPRGPMGGAGDGVVLVETGDAGTVLDVFGVYIPGTVYSDTGSAATDAADGWVMQNRTDDESLDTNNPADFGKFIDKKGNPTKCVLDGKGFPAGGIAGVLVPPGSIHIEKYAESNFLELGIPTSLTGTP